MFVVFLIVLLSFFLSYSTSCSYYKLFREIISEKINAIILGRRIHVCFVLKSDSSLADRYNIAVRNAFDDLGELLSLIHI